MKSTIRVDFKGLDGENGFEPIIRVNLQESEDVRDSLMKEFFQGTHYIKVMYIQNEEINSNILLTPMKEDIFSRKLPSLFNIDDKVQFTKEESGILDCIGKIVSIRFTKAKVWYDILDDYSGDVFKDIPSENVTN